jgi:hypothetical protein
VAPATTTEKAAEDAVHLLGNVIKNDNQCAVVDAYLSLCLRAAEAGTDLAEAAALVVARDMGGRPEGG